MVWPFSWFRKTPRAAPSGVWRPGPGWQPGRGPDGFGGDPFWSWGSVAAQGISPEAAEALAAVTSAVNIISGTIASLPAFVTRSDDSRANVPNHPLQRLIDQGCNDDETWSDLVESLLASALLRGNGIASLESASNGRLTSLTTRRWDNTTVRVTDSGALLFDFLPMVPPNAGQRRTFLRQDLVWLKDRSDDGILGTPRIQRAASALALALNVERAAQTFNANSARPAGTLNAPGKVSEPLANRLAESWDENFRGERLGKTAVLSEGLEFKPLSQFTAEDAQIVAHRGFTVSDVARIFSVPLFFLGDPQRATYASAKEASRQLAVQALAPWVAKLQRAFAQSVLGEQYRLIIDLDSLMRADAESFYGALLKARQGAWLSPNDVREITGWPRVANDPKADALDPPNTSAQAAANAAGGEGGDDAGAKVVELAPMSNGHAAD